MWQEFKKFAFKGNVIDLAVGVIIGGAFGKIVTSVVSDLLMPLIGLIFGKIDFSSLYLALDGKTYATLAEAQAVNAPVFAYGNFITTLIDFFIIALCIFLMVKGLNKLQRKKDEQPEENPARLCPFCYGEIDEKATRCPHCTSLLSAATAGEDAAAKQAATAGK